MYGLNGGACGRSVGGMELQIGRDGLIRTEISGIFRSIIEKLSFP